MKVRSVLSLAAANLGRDDLVAAINDCADEPSGEVASLLRCYNLVENEIALDYFPLRYEEELCVCGEILPYSRLSFAPVEILSVSLLDGTALDFEARPARILLRGTRGERKLRIRYDYSPKEKCFCDHAELGGKISARLLSFGVACEFCLSEGMFAEAAVWEKKFREALRAANVVHRRLCIRSRRWA